MPSWVHESVAVWLNKVEKQAIRNQLLPPAWDRTIDLAGTPKFENFTGNYVGRAKEPDSAFIPRIGPGYDTLAPFPSVVLEAGYSETASRQSGDAMLWREGSSYAVKVVLLPKFQRTNDQRHMSLVLTIGRAFPDTAGETTLFQDYLAVPNPTISFDEFYSGHCPDMMDPETQIPLDLALFRETADAYIRREGYIPA